jgi:hypothetical protein
LPDPGEAFHTNGSRAINAAVPANLGIDNNLALNEIHYGTSFKASIAARDVIPLASTPLPLSRRPARPRDLGDETEGWQLR